MDAQGGVQYEGETPPQACPADHLAIRVHNLLANGTGGLDWAALPLVASWLGVVDVDALLARLEVIKLHRPADDSPPAPQAQAPALGSDLDS